MEVSYMSDLMELLYEYAQQRRVSGFLDLRAYTEAGRLEAKHLAALKEGLSGEHMAALERYQDACREQHVMDQEAMFLAAFSVARELYTAYL